MYIHNGGAKTVEHQAHEMVIKFTIFSSNFTFFVNFNLIKFSQTKEVGGIHPDYLTMMEERHMNKKTGEIQDLEIHEIVESCKKKKTDRLTQLLQLTLNSSSSNELSREEINTIVLAVSFFLFFVFRF